jgi:tight adherence protein B
MDPMNILIIGGGVAVVLLLIGLIVSTREAHSLVDDRLKYLEESGYSDTSNQDRSLPMTEWIGEQATRFTWGQQLSRNLSRADIKLRVGEYIALTLLTTLLGAALGWFLAGGSRNSYLIISLPGLILGACIGFFGPQLYIRRMQAKRLVRFDSQLADMLNLIVNGIRAGYSTMQAMEAVSRELAPPIADEFRRVVQEMQLGISLEAALDNLTKRIPSRDLELVVTAMNVQREVGGNLAEILETISHTIRERVRVKGEIRVLTSQVMISGRLLALMPAGLIIAMYFFNRGYMMRFFNPVTRWIGIPALILGLTLIVLGYWLMTRIADIEV